MWAIIKVHYVEQACKLRCHNKVDLILKYEDITCI